MARITNSRRRGAGLARVTMIERGLAGLNSAMAANYENLAPAQRRVIDKLVEDKRYAAISTLPDISRDLGVSQSTVTRAAQVLGFKGFPDLQSRMRDHFAGSVSDRVDLMAMELDGSPHSSVTRVVLEDADALRSAAEDFDTEAIGQALDALVGARRVYVFAVGGSHGLAEMLGAGLRLALDDVRLVGGQNGGFADELLGLDKPDVLIGINFRRLDAPTVRAVEWAAKMGATTIVITDAPASRMARIASVGLFVPSSRLRLTPSYTTATSLINGLLTAVGLATSRASKARHKRWETLRRHFGELYPDENGRKANVVTRQRKQAGSPSVDAKS